MRKISPIQRIQQAIVFFETNPTMEQLVKYLSKNLDPKGEDAGICSYIVKDNGVIEYADDFGFEETLDRNVIIRVEDDNPLSIAVRTQKIQIVDMKSLYDDYKDSTHKQLQSQFSTGMAMSLDLEVAIGVLLKPPYATIMRQREYFECINEVMRSWYACQSKNVLLSESRNISVSNKLSERQSKIIELIKENRTNASIASILGYSESLIRQETIQIYRKLGIDGRKQLFRVSLEKHQLSSV